MIPYRKVQTENFKTLLSYTRFFAAIGYVLLFVVLVGIGVEFYNKGMETNLAIASFAVAPIVVIGISGILALLISLEEHSRVARGRS